MMKVIIAGSRDIREPIKVHDAIAAAVIKIPIITEVVCGEAEGVDKIGKAWAKAANIPIKSFPADWKTWGKVAGFKRNRDMADYADALIAVWDGKSKGTHDMIELMAEMNKPIYVYVP